MSHLRYDAVIVTSHPSTFGVNAPSNENNCIPEKTQGLRYYDHSLVHVLVGISNRPFCTMHGFAAGRRAEIQRTLISLYCVRLNDLCFERRLETESQCVGLPQRTETLWFNTRKRQNGAFEVLHIEAINFSKAAAPT